MPEAIDAAGEPTSPDYEDMTPLFMRHMAMYEYFLGYVKGKKTLEVCCGEGYGTDFLAREAAEITGIDASQELVDHARNKYARKNVWFMRGDATEFPFHGEAFDVVVSTRALDQVKDYRKFLHEVKKALRDGGTALIAAPNGRSAIAGVNPYRHREFSAGGLRAALRKVFSKVEVAALFGSPRYRELRASEQGLAGKILALDFLRLRRLAPRFMTEPLYRRAFGASGRSQEAKPGQGGDITVSDFWVGRDNPDKGLDLIGICVK